MLDDHEELLELDGDLDDRRQDDDEGSVLLAGGDTGVEGLDHLGLGCSPFFGPHQMGVSSTVVSMFNFGFG
jgi:hypothetical protein